MSDDYYERKRESREFSGLILAWCITLGLLILAAVTILEFIN